MSLFDDIKLYLPKYLSASSEKELYKELKEFPKNIDNGLYTSTTNNSNLIYQGDGLSNLLVINLPEITANMAPGMVLSNTCDIDINNERLNNTQIVYSPIFNLEKYRSSLMKNSKDDPKTFERIESHIDTIKRQLVTQIFYLPKIHGKLEDSIVFFDRVINFPNKRLERNEVPNQRIFTLSNYGFYLFIMKLSIHFTRIRENVDRSRLIV